MTSSAPLEPALRRSPVQNRSEERIDRILTATAHLIGQTPPEGITTTRVATAAGMSVGSIYRYFDGVDAIFHALLQRAVAELVVCLRSDGLTLAGADWRADISRALDVQVEYIQNLDTGLYALWFASSGAVAASAALATRGADESLVGELIAELPADRLARLGEDPESVVLLALGILTKGTELAFTAPQAKANLHMIDEAKRAAIGYLSSYLD